MEEQDWQVGDHLIAVSAAAKAQNYQGARITGGENNSWEVTRKGYPSDHYPIDHGFSNDTMNQHFKIDIDSRVTDEDVEKARKGLEELLN